MSRLERTNVTQIGSKQAANKGDVWRPGVFLQERSNQQRVWVQCTKIDGLEREIILGKFPSMTMADARKAALSNREMIDAGVDVLSRRRLAKQQHLKSRLQQMTEQVDSDTVIRTFKTANLMSQKKAQQSRNEAGEGTATGRRRGITLLTRKITAWFRGYAKAPEPAALVADPTPPIEAPLLLNDPIDVAQPLDLSEYKTPAYEPSVASADLEKSPEAPAIYVLSDPVIAAPPLEVSASSKVAQLALERAGPSVLEIIKGLLGEITSPEQHENIIHHFSELLSKHGGENLDAACEGALMLRIGTLECVTSILESTDPTDFAENTRSTTNTIAHANIRGAGYFN